jgi:hypothetical protein
MYQFEPVVLVILPNTKIKANYNSCTVILYHVKNA